MPRNAEEWRLLGTMRYIDPGFAWRDDYFAKAIDGIKEIMLVMTIRNEQHIRFLKRIGDFWKWCHYDRDGHLWFTGEEFSTCELKGVLKYWSMYGEIKEVERWEYTDADKALNPNVRNRLVIYREHWC